MHQELNPVHLFSVNFFQLHSSLLCSLTEIKGSEGKDLTLPCSAPIYLNKPSLQWTFSSSNESTQILTYNSQSGRSITLSPWEEQVELDIYNVHFGDGSVRLMNPHRSRNAGGYTCVFSTPYSSHTERNKVTFSAGEDTQTQTSPESVETSVQRSTQFSIFCSKT